MAESSKCYKFKKRCAGGSSGPKIETEETSVTIDKNGTTELEAAEGKAFSKVTITTAVKQNYCLVRFYNDNRTTLLYEVLVPYGSSAVYAGDAPVSSLGADYIFTGFEPSTESVTADTDCYAVYDEPVVPDTPEISTLDGTSWADIAAISNEGTAENYFAVGDTKAVTLNGKVGADLTLTNATYYVYIIGFNHNSSVEGNGIHFGTFKSAATGGTDIALIDNYYGQHITDGTMCFNSIHWNGNTTGGWKGCDLRYDVLGSTNVAPSGYGATVGTGRTGFDATETCATSPVPNTLMAALPAELRAVLKPMTKYTDGTASIDYLPLLSISEMSATTKANEKQYAYYAAGNSVKKYKQNNLTDPLSWRLRSVETAVNIYIVNMSGKTAGYGATRSVGLAPIFKV